MTDQADIWHFLSAAALNRAFWYGILAPQILADRNTTRGTWAMAKQKTLDFGGNDDKPVAIRRNTLKGRVVRRELSARFASEAVGPIEPGMEVYALTMGKFSLVDVIEHCLATTGPADLVVSTWTAAGADIGFASRMLADGRLRSLRFVVDYSFPSRQPAYCAALREAFGDDAIRVTKNHAKFVLIRNERWSLVVRTSMNLNECRRLETVELSDCPAMADWLAEVVDKLFDGQDGKEGLERNPGGHCERFGEEWGNSMKGELGSSERRFFSDTPAGVDLRRVGINRRA